MKCQPWHLFLFGTALGACGADKPGEHSAAPTTPTPALAFTEFVSETHDRHEWFEVRNAGDEAVDLAGLVLHSTVDDPVTLETSFVLDAGGYAIFADSDEVAHIEADIIYGEALMVGASATLSLFWRGESLDTLPWSELADATRDETASVAVDGDYARADLNDSTDVWCQSQNIYDSDESRFLYGTPGTPNDPCPQVDHDGDGMSSEEGDCDDADPDVHSDDGEIWYDGIDSDCDGGSDYDQDGDGEDAEAYGGTDCDDTEGTVHSDAWERCNEIDDDCNGEIDDIEFDRWFRDADEDGYGDPAVASPGCEQTEGTVNNLSDCDDTNPEIYLGAPETWYDGVDSDCGGENDYDQDGDAYEVASHGGEDCDDTEAAAYPGASEVCDDVDNDCDGGTDEDDPDLEGTDHYFPDEDGDGYGRTLAAGLAFCDLPAGYVSDYSDCDDTDAAVHPGATETWYDGVDEDCDGAGDNDADGDGWDQGDGFVYDCDDTDDSIYPGAPDYLGIEGIPCYERLVLLDLSGVNATETNSGLGESLAGAGDLDGDGVQDVLLGLPYADSTEASESGYAAIVLGRADGAVLLSDTAATINGLNSGDIVGGALAGLGDVDADGYGDLVLGANGLDDVDTGAGGAYLVMGPVSGDMSLADATAVLLGVHRRDGAGWQVDSLADWDEDGADELLIGAPNEDTAASSAGAVYLLGLDTTGTVSLADADATLQGDAAEDRAGKNLVSAGDTDGDGVADVLTGSYTATASGASAAGVVWLATGPISGTFSLSSAEARLEGASADDALGSSLIALGDDDGDGYDDFAIGATGLTYDGTLTDAGGAYLFHGPVTGTSTAEATAFATVLGDVFKAGAGNALAWPGDLDDDGVSDLVIGARTDGSAGHSRGGAVYILLGPFSGSRDLSSADDVKYGAQDNETAGDALAGPGDVTGDGVGDLLVGTPGRGEGGAAWLLTQR